MRASLRKVLPRIAIVLLVALVVVVATVVVSPTITPGPTIDRIDNPAHDLSNIVPEEPDASGNVTVEVASDRGTVLIDFAHTNRITAEEIGPFTTAIRDAGYRVEFLESTFGMEAKLSESDAFVVIDPGGRYSETEVDAVESFVEKGGRLAVFGEPTRASVAGPLGGLVRQTNQLENLADRFGIDFGSDYLFNMRENDGIFRNVFATAGGDGDIGSGVDRVAMYTATQVSATEGRTVLTATDATRSSRGDAPGRYSVGVRAGNVLAFGDASFLVGGNYKVVDNEGLIGNVVSFLLDGERRRTLLDYPANVEDDPSIRYTSADLLGAAQTLSGEFRGGGEHPRLTLEAGRIDAAATEILVTTFDDLANRTTAGTGIDLTDEEVSVPGFSADREGVAVVRAPEAGQFDAVIAADTASNAEGAVDILADGELDQYAVSNSTLVIRTAGGSEFDDGGV